MIDELKKELQRTPLELLKREWEEIIKSTSTSSKMVKVNDLIRHWNCLYGSFHSEIKPPTQNQIINETPKFFGVSCLIL
ncbi:MAG: hypothetical protein KFKLKKLM_00718 [Flavobacteriales bacterium]|nr:hypothetical protein [Flavobacteriales bacterium]